MKPSTLLTQTFRVDGDQGVLALIGVGELLLELLGTTLFCTAAPGSNEILVKVPRGETGVVAVSCGYRDSVVRNVFLLRVFWDKDGPCFDREHSYLPPADRLSTISTEGITINCDGDEYYAPNPHKSRSHVKGWARMPKPGEKIIYCDDACMFLGEKITKAELDDRIRQRIAREDQLAELQQRLTTVESQRQDEVAARHRDHEAFEQEMTMLVLEKDEQRIKYGEQLQSDFDRTPLCRLARQRFTAWWKEFRQKFAV